MLDKNTSKMGYSVNIFKMKYKTVNGKEKLSIDDNLYYPNVSFYMALGIVIQLNGCKVIGRYNNETIDIFSAKKKQILGISDRWAGSFIIAVINAPYKIKTTSSDISMPNKIPFGFGRFKDLKRLKVLHQQLVSFEAEKQFQAPNTLHLQFIEMANIPKGWYRITSTVKQNDYYWDNDDRYPSWTICSISFSSVKVGTRPHSFQFVIRKIN